MGKQGSPKFPRTNIDHVDQYHSTAEDMGADVPGLCKTGQNYLDCQRWRSQTTGTQFNFSAPSSC